jgi:hypothetical protein
VKKNLKGKFKEDEISWTFTGKTFSGSAIMNAQAVVPSTAIFGSSLIDPRAVGKYIADVRLYCAVITVGICVDILIATAVAMIIFPGLFCAVALSGFAAFGLFTITGIVVERVINRKLYATLRGKKRIDDAVKKLKNGEGNGDGNGIIHGHLKGDFVKFICEELGGDRKTWDVARPIYYDALKNISTQSFNQANCWRFISQKDAFTFASWLMLLNGARVDVRHLDGGYAVNFMVEGLVVRGDVVKEPIFQGYKYEGIHWKLEGDFPEMCDFMFIILRTKDLTEEARNSVLSALSRVAAVSRLWTLDFANGLTVHLSNREGAIALAEIVERKLNANANPWIGVDGYGAEDYEVRIRAKE